MEKELVKQAVKEAENSLKDKQVAEVKQIVLKTLEKISRIDKEIDETKSDLKELEEQKKILRMDIEDLRDGRVDRIAERQEKDEKAKKVSVVIIIKEKEVIREVSPWYMPYQVIWPTTIPSYSSNAVYCQTSNLGASSINSVLTASNTYEPMEINCSVAKYSTIGTYDVDGKVINLR